jgi:hypothetical protein
VFDGTMAWRPFVAQTVAMLRDSDYTYSRGPGFHEADDGRVTEMYWVKGAKRDVPVRPYHVEVIGVTVEIPVAVERGLVRKLVSGRGVPVRKQLESHREFSAHFEEYASWVDAATLFDMTCSNEGATEASDIRRGIIACKPGMLFPRNSDGTSGLIVENASAYARFIAKKCINVSASSASELWV